MPTSISQARANKKWQENNREKYLSICLESTKKYNMEHKNEIKIKQHEYYILRKSKLIKIDPEII